MENKYYTPDITDLRVGYECEKIQMEFDKQISLFLKEGASDEEYEKAWNWHYNSDEVKSKKHLITKEELRSLLEFDKSKGLRESSGTSLQGNFRTPYLTKEQIVVEGWQSVSGEYFEGKFTKENFQLNFYSTEDRFIEIAKYFNFEKNRGWNGVYYGACPSINEFRYICKLLGI